MRTRPKTNRFQTERAKIEEITVSRILVRLTEFGLVNVPVLVFPASRNSGVRLRMMSPEGSLLERRFFCPRDGKEVPS